MDAAVGNAIVWKPSEWTPLSASHLMACFLEAGVPEGALNLVLGEPAVVGDEVAGHPGVVAIGLTGSSRTGEIVAARAAGKPMLLELGGNGPTIVFDDADLEHAVRRVAFGSFANSGQICNSHDDGPGGERAHRREDGRAPGRCRRSWRRALGRRCAGRRVPDAPVLPADRDRRRPAGDEARRRGNLVNVNEASAYWQPHTPAGGFSGKRSGMGRIGGMYTLLEMTQVKTIVIDVSERAP